MVMNVEAKTAEHTKFFFGEVVCCPHVCDSKIEGCNVLIVVPNVKQIMKMMGMSFLAAKRRRKCGGQQVCGT
jgi:hypothetical protein